MIYFRLISDLAEMIPYKVIRRNPPRLQVGKLLLQFFDHLLRCILIHRLKEPLGIYFPEFCKIPIIREVNSIYALGPRILDRDHDVVTGCLQRSFKRLVGDKLRSSSRIDWVGFTRQEVGFLRVLEKSFCVGTGRFINDACDRRVS